MAIELTLANINEQINEYKNKLSEIPLYIGSSNILEFLIQIKRTPLHNGPYPDVSFFEAANRIMSDLVILYGVQDLLNGKIPEICFSKYTVDLGHGNTQMHDIMAKKNTEELIGEAFNVSESLFQSKTRDSLNKLRKNKAETTSIIIVYNSDAKGIILDPTKKEYSLPVDVGKILI
jgi:hypothetical protein